MSQAIAQGSGLFPDIHLSPVARNSAFVVNGAASSTGKEIQDKILEIAYDYKNVISFEESIFSPAAFFNSHLKELESNKIQESRIQQKKRLPMLLAEVDEIASECSVADWDGYDAPPLEVKSISYAKLFMTSIIEHGIVLPDEIDAESSGYMAMSWINNGYDVAFSVNPAGIVEWGGISPNGHIYGDAKLGEDNSIPKEVISALLTIHSA